MKKSLVSGVSAIVVSVSVVGALAFDRHENAMAQVASPAAGAPSEPDALCPRGNATLRGVYMSKGGGTVVGVGPVAFIGTVYFDGKGGITNPFTLSFVGAISRVSGTATYTVSSDCSATFTTTDGTQHFDMRVSPDGSTVDYIETDSGTVISGTGIRVHD